MSQRLAYIICLFVIVVSLGTGLYLEYFDGVIPCPLCTLQRICFSILGIIFFIGIVAHRKRCTKIATNLLGLIFSIVGAGLAARQIWIQYYPSGENGECGVSLQYMLEVLPLHDVIGKIFTGSAECTQRGWEMFGLNIPEWSLMFFITFALVCLLYLLKSFKR